MLTLGVQAQTLKQWSDLGEEAIEENDCASAALYFGEAFALDSSNFDLTVQYAEALRCNKEFYKAEYYYSKVFTKDRGRLFPPGQFYLASMQKINGDYKTALRNFKKFYSKTKRKPLTETPLAGQEIESCTWALNVRKVEGKANVERLEGNLNTEQSEFAPFLVDSSLYYSSWKSDGFVSERVAIYSASVHDSLYHWQPDFSSNANDPNMDCGNLSFSADGKRAYYSKCSDICRIYEAQVLDGQIQNERAISVFTMDNCNSSMPTVGFYKGNEVLFYSSDRKGTRGQMDIWWSERQTDGSWGAPVNAGDNVNTKGNEVTPFFINEQLYFSSDWHIGFGGFDVQISRGYPRSFDVPENAGYPLNSSYNDLYYIYHKEVNRGYMASNRPFEESPQITCCNDVFSVTFRDSIPEEKDDIYASLASLNDYLPVTLYFHNDEPNPNTRDTTTTLTYLEAYDSYKLLESKYIKENTKGKQKEEKENAQYNIEDFFELNVDKGLSDLKIFKKLLLEELEAGTSVELIIKGFASPRAESDYNVNLTKRRIASLINLMEVEDAGSFAPYINGLAHNGAVLKFTEVPFGEYKADQEVSDQLNNEKESIYSVGASLERKIEIQSVQRIVADSIFSTMDFESEVHNFGQIEHNSENAHAFQFINNGNDTLYIDSISSPCGCTVPTLSSTVLLPGEEGSILVQFLPEGQFGLLNKTILIYSNASTEPKEIVITAESSR